MGTITNSTKNQQLQEILKKEIFSGQYQFGEKFHSQNELADMYDISHVTAREATGALEQEGLLKRVQGKGTFIQRTSPEMSAQEMVGLVVRTTGHLFGPLSSEIVRGLSASDHVCFLVECPAKQENTDKINSVIGRAPGFLVVDGHFNFPFDVLSLYDGHLIFVHSFESQRAFPADRVLCNFHEAGRQAVDHLLTRGHSRVAMLTYDLGPDCTGQASRIEGARVAFREHGIPPDNLTILPNSDAESTETLLQDIAKPVGVFADGDFRAKWIYSAARKHGWKIPDDLAVVGFYNTPWCEALHPNLTSVSIRTENMAREVVRIVIEENDEREEVLIEPELVVRDSSGARDNCDRETRSQQEGCHT